MQFRAIVTLFLTATLCWQSGCALIEPTQQMTRQSMRIFRFRPADYRDHTSEEEDQWDYVGKEGRGNQMLEDENDPFKKWLMSPKARNIERNLGFE